MRERAASGFPVELGLWNGLAPLETWICASCGHAEWYTGSARPAIKQHNLVLRISAAPEATCPKCGAREQTLVSPVVENPDEPAVLPVDLRAPAGFACLLCDTCKLVRWMAIGSGLEAGDPLWPCKTCDGPTSGIPLVMDRVRAPQNTIYPVTSFPLPIHLDIDENGDAVARGSFSASYCGKCGLVAWRAQRLHELFPSQEVALLKAESTGAAGPYR
jgi:hypothetical protein